jgi:hypothetical protein
MFVSSKKNKEKILKVQNISNNDEDEESNKPKNP